MIRLLTGAARPTGGGAYVADLARAFPGEVEIFRHRTLTPEEYELTRPEDGWWDDARLFLEARWKLRESAARTHVAGESFGPVFGHRTRLVTMHQVFRRVPPGAVRRVGQHWLRATLAIRGFRRLAELGIDVVASSHSTAWQFRREFRADPARLCVVPLAVDSGFFTPGDRLGSRARLGLPTRAFLVLHISRDDIRKNVPMVLRVHRRLRRRVPRARLVHVGESAALASHLSDRPDPSCLYLPGVPRETLRDLYRAADVLFHPSWVEGFSFPVLEAMACGTPALVSALDVFREELGPWYWGHSPDDVRSFAEALESLARGELRMEATALRNHVRREFSFDRFARQYRSLYRSVGLLGS
jgi:glycosyltransferase involved in cell wall biosynthesis